MMTCKRGTSMICIGLGTISTTAHTAVYTAAALTDDAPICTRSADGACVDCSDATFFLVEASLVS
jgi:hypothetical protein